MTQIVTADRRRIEAEPDLQAHEQAVALARGFVDHQIGLARVLCRIRQTKTFVRFDCASIEEYGVRIGLSWRDTRQLVDLAESLEAPVPLAATAPSPESEPLTPATGDTANGEAGERPVKTVEEAIRDGDISVGRAAMAGKLLSKPELLREGEDPVALAMENSARRMQALIREREEENAQQQPVTPLAFAVTPQAKEDFARARIVASERAGTMLTEGETLALVTRHYLDDFDPLRHGAGARRLPDTAEIPASRYVPAEVKRAVRSRSGGQCEVPGCPHRAFLQFCHIEPHRDGGSREADQLLHLCGVHHVLFDAGRIRFNGWEDGRPRFRDTHGRVLEERATLHTPPGIHEDSDAFDRSGPDAGQVAERPPPGWNVAV